MAKTLLSACCEAPLKYCQEVVQYYNAPTFSVDDLDAEAFEEEGLSLNELVDKYGPVSEENADDGGDFSCSQCGKGISELASTIIRPT